MPHEILCAETAEAEKRRTKVSVHNRLEQKKTLPSGSPTGLRRWSMGGTAGDLGGPSRVRDGFAYRKISFRRNLHGLHAGFRFGPRLEHTEAA